MRDKRRQRTRVEGEAGREKRRLKRQTHLVLHHLAMRRGLWMWGRLGNWLLRWRGSHVRVLAEADKTASVRRHVVAKRDVRSGDRRDVFLPGKMREAWVRQTWLRSEAFVPTDWERLDSVCRPRSPSVSGQKSLQRLCNHQPFLQLENTCTSRKPRTVVRVCLFMRRNPFTRFSKCLATDPRLSKP